MFWWRIKVAVLPAIPLHCSLAWGHIQATHEWIQIIFDTLFSINQSYSTGWKMMFHTTSQWTLPLSSMVWWVALKKTSVLSFHDLEEVTPSLAVQRWLRLTKSGWSAFIGWLMDISKKARTYCSPVHAHINTGKECSRRLSSITDAHLTSFGVRNAHLAAAAIRLTAPMMKDDVLES